MGLKGLNMKKLYTVFLSLLLISMMTSCAAPSKRLATPSGKPEITVHGVTKKQIIDLLVSHKLSEGFQVRTVNDYSLVIAKDIDDFAARVAYGSNYNRTPEARVTYNFVDTNGGVKIFVRSEMVTNPQSQHEKTTNFTTTWGEYSQAELERIKKMMEK